MRRPDGHPVLAAVLDLAMRPMAGLRHKVVPLAAGRVLEVGVGTGLNAAVYATDQLTELVGIEPDPHMLARARPRYDALPLPVRLVQCGAEAMPFADGHFDTIILTFTLCTIPDVESAVREMFRVLAPGGTLHFAEHTTSDHRPMQIVQGVVDPVWNRLAGGCHLTRDAVQLLERGGFQVESVYPHGRGPFRMAPIHRGLARKPVQQGGGERVNGSA